MEERQSIFWAVGAVAANRVAAAVLATLMAALFGCTPVPNFPVSSMRIGDQVGSGSLGFDVNRDGKADYWQQQDPAGRKTVIRYDDNKDGEPDATVELDAIAPAECPHLIIVLDGVPFELVAQLYEEGRFRLFHPPSRLISCFPSMTDLALARAFHVGPPLACESLYFDRAGNRLSDGNAVYLSMQNAPWVKSVNYRCSFWLDANAYLNPRFVFSQELEGMLATFRKAQGGQVVAYTVATAGLGTRGGSRAIREYLATIDRLCEQLVHERRGKVKISLFADHGHNLTPCRRVSFKQRLANAGYRVTKRLDGPRDVVIVEYGLVTYAALYTSDPAGVSAALLEHRAIDLACYPQGDWVVVRNAQGEARVGYRDGRYRYEARDADPLALARIIEQLGDRGKITPDGYIDDRALFEATVAHVYPDPLSRIWLAFHELVRWPPDLIVSLRDGYAHGSKLFDLAIGGAVSTHGSLNRANATTFVLSMLAELPPAVRLEQVLPALDRARRGGLRQADQPLQEARR